MNQARHILREATAQHHERVDAAFAGFDLADAGSYLGFLSAHARVLPAAENSVSLGWDRWRKRTPLLLQDLADLGAEPLGGAPDCLLEDLNLAEPAAHWGVLYVLEGSRLGGSVLAEQVGAGFPRRYLSAGHTGGSWRAFQEALEAAASPIAGRPVDGGWMEPAVAAARSLFERFESAAHQELGRLRGH